MPLTNGRLPGRSRDPGAAEELRFALRRRGDTWQVVFDPGGSELQLGRLEELIARLRRLASAERKPPRGLR